MLKLTTSSRYEKPLCGVGKITYTTKIMEDNNRQKALAWWRLLSPLEKKTVVDNWKNIDGGYRTNWSMRLIETSSSTIEMIFDWYIKTNG